MKLKRKKSERRKKTKTIHVINKRTTEREEALARIDMISFFTKRMF